jgi:hypothetical protein
MPLETPLTRQEITLILEGIGELTHAPSSALTIPTQLNHVQAYTEYAKALSSYTFTTDRIKRSKQIAALSVEIRRQYNTSLVQAGESVGLLAAQSIGERQTQLVLNTFHTTGISVATVVTGVPRFSELLGASKHTKNALTTLRMKEGADTSTFRRLLRTTLRTFAVPNRGLTRAQREFETQILAERSGVTHILTVPLSLGKLFKHRSTPQHIASRITASARGTSLGLVAVPSSPELGLLVLFSTMGDVIITAPTLYALPVCESDFTDGVVDALAPSTVQLVGNDFYALVESPDAEHFDLDRSYSNYLWEIYETLGVEATRAFLIDEFLGVISSDAYINRAHVALLVDTMLYTGSITSISRYGVIRNQSGPLTKCTFEEPLEHLLEAGMNGDVERVEGVSAAVMLGRPARIGTGLCSLRMRV